MATRYFCDGCDQEVGDNRTFVVGISTPTEIMEEMRKGNQAALGGETYHLCDYCEKSLKVRANPKAWTRDTKAA